MMLLAAAAIAGCLAVNAGADRILAGDLAAAIPGLTVPAPAAIVGLAPAPGVQRVFHVPELRRMAAALGWPALPDADICIERPVSPPDPARLRAAMQHALPQAGIAILEFSRQPLPSGELVFPASGLRSGSAGALWIGYVAYAGTRRFPLWARVKVLISVARVIAAADLRPGQAIAADQLRAETRDEPPQTAAYLPSPADAIGKWPRVPIRAGTALRTDMLREPQDVLRGDTVLVDVRNGAAHLELEAQAEASGAVGDIIAVRNPSSHQRFLARVEGKDRVLVDSSAGSGKPGNGKPGEGKPDKGKP